MKLLSIPLMQILCREIVNFDNFYPLDWQSKAKFFDCGYIKYFGFSGSHNSSIIFLDLEPHSHYRIDAEVLRYLFNCEIDSIDGYKEPNFYVENILANQDITVKEDYICGNSSPEYFYTISIVSTHNRRTLWVLLNLAIGGIRKFQISTIKCQSECEACIDNYMKSCQEWKLYNFSLNKKSIYISEGWTFTQIYFTEFSCGNCKFLLFNSITYYRQLPPHQHLLIRFYKKNNVQLVIDYIYGQQVTTNEQYTLIEILIKNHPDPILRLNIKTLNALDNCYIRDFELFYTPPEILFQQLSLGCADSLDNQCLNCQEGWIINAYLQICQPKCGDSIIQGDEECDDGNQIAMDGCFECKFSCTDFCKTCQFGICQGCESGFVINLNHICDPLCGDGLVIPYSAEQCEIMDNKIQDDCQNCRFHSVTNCKTFHYSKCLECNQGFYNSEYSCYPYCGDKIILKQYEDCDDGNEQPYDGCYECKYQCIQGCNICDHGQCILKCEDGYKFVNNSCISICGDSIITKEEDCEDGNLIEFDGCYKCKFSCPKNCNDCYQGTCLGCDNQYQLSNSNECKQNIYCGNGLLQESEDCDDGNDLAIDGCKDCRIEINWICNILTTYSPSQCTFVKSPNLFVNYLNMTQNKQYISILFNQQVKIYTQQLLSETLVFELENLNTKIWNYNLQIIQDVGSYACFGEYVLEIEINSLLEFRPNLKISINQKVANIDNADLINYSKSISLQYPQYLTEKQQDYSEMMKNSNTYMIYCLSGFTTISLLFGNGNFFFEILNILQFQQYLRYINLQYPLNLEIYFCIYDLITIQPILDKIHFLEIFKLFDIEIYQEYSKGKFQIYKQNSNLIVNLSSQIIQCLSILFLVWIFRFIKTRLYIKIFCQKYFDYMQTLSLFFNSSIFFKFSRAFYKICLHLIKLEKNLNYQGLQKILLLNSWDVIFKTLLFTKNIQMKNLFDFIQISTLVTIVIVYFAVVLNSLNLCTNIKYSLFKMSVNQRIDILNFSRQVLFLFFIIYIQDSQILQLELLLLTSIFQITLIYYHHDVLEKSNYIFQMTLEISVFIFMLTSFLYIQDFNNFFYEEKKIILGWIHAAILSISIQIKLIKICQGGINILRSKCQKLQQGENQLKS